MCYLIYKIRIRSAKKRFRKTLANEYEHEQSNNNSFVCVCGLQWFGGLCRCAAQILMIANAQIGPNANTQIIQPNTAKNFNITILAAIGWTRSTCYTWLYPYPAIPCYLLLPLPHVTMLPRYTKSIYQAISSDQVKTTKQANGRVYNLFKFKYSSLLEFPSSQFWPISV